METNTLNAFLAVAESGSFSAAAQQLHLSQPAVSKRVAALEEELKSRLFDRLGRRVRLTEAGRQLLPRARQLRLDIADIRRDISNLSGRASGTLTMGTSHHIGLRRLPPVLKRYSLRHPGVTLDIRFMDSEAVCGAVEQGELELGVVTLPTHTPESLQALAVWDDPLRFVVAEDHPLAGGHAPGLEELMAHPAVLTTRGTYTREILDRALERRGLQARPAMATNYLETLKMMVEIGLGWGVLPLTLLDKKGMRKLRFEGLRLTRTLGIVTHRRRTLSNAAVAMRDTCLEFASPPQR
ncbi:MAG: LysR family transcriptional regulator [Candidatus Sedimenticola endophacoides]|uniref:LysR family transcriptional regulator n=2 Tax=Candidatus Sedimenticola endophacoides TaxID=2548426 RepID=A0A6N4DTX4_9GAMM|nr:MAG: LysR family transcriptional regulator [Candidatus Sedimenticola endophacoides]OQX34867.1 MAG: LysR family transcriptional regulator [Candidatus Sedimenticola endophacoides]OQX40251.1 MAG: LysR family transcriptional regulator [Candidatus Sedimenticola endophacoides]OQX46083.1 MAG: LysR family transcriptional regulator [Candidatus Sedimenticola endophacoides]PUD98552.1 MAG: LysR family transcriptional regulator [Candidatus Sedimenticola endophacoides]